TVAPPTACAHPPLRLPPGRAGGVRGAGRAAAAARPAWRWDRGLLQGVSRTYPSTARRPRLSPAPPATTPAPTGRTTVGTTDERPDPDRRDRASIGAYRRARRWTCCGNAGRGPPSAGGGPVSAAGLPLGDSTPA